MGQLLSCRVPLLFNDRPNPIFNRRGAKHIINWGNGGGQTGAFQSVFNEYEAVNVAGNKLTTFQLLKDQDGIRIPEFTTDRTVATGWLRDGGSVVCRTVLRGHSGAGIVLVTDKAVELPDAPLYVRYIKKQKEFRVHVCFGEVIDVQEKRKRAELPEGFNTNYQVRNHQTGWVYCREAIEEPMDLRTMATRTVAQTGLDFGAVDIIWNEKRNESYVLEVNTAPGLEGTTVDKYAEAFVKRIKE